MRLALACLGFFTLLVILSTASGEKCKAFSSTETCKQLHQIELSLDDNIEPCDDFYGYACNNWSLQQLSAAYNTTVDLVDHNVNLKLITILETLYQQYRARNKTSNSENQSIFDKAVVYYKSCIRESSHDVLKYFEIIKPAKNLDWPLFDYIPSYRKKDPIFPKWPHGQQFCIYSLLGQLQSYGLNDAIISCSFLRRSNGLLYIWLGKPKLRQDDVLPLSLIKQLLIGRGVTTEEADTFLQNVYRNHAFWLSKYNIMDIDPGVAQFSYEELRQRFPPLGRFVEAMLKGKIQDQDKIIVGNVQYIQYLINMQLAEGEILGVCHYLMVKFMTYIWRDIIRDFNKLDCVKDLRNKLDLPLNLLYYENILETEDTAAASFVYDINAMFNKSRHYLGELIEKNHLRLSRPQRQELYSKLQKVSLNIGNFPRNLNPTQTERFYRDIPNLEVGNYYGNRLHLMKHHFHKLLLDPLEETYYTYVDYRTGIHSTPFYASQQEMIMLPLGAIAPPIYHHTFSPLFAWTNMIMLLTQALVHVVAPHSDALKLGFQDDFMSCLRQQDYADHNAMEFMAYLVATRVAYEGYSSEFASQLQPDFTNMPWQKLFFLSLSQFFCGSRVTHTNPFNPYPKFLRKIVMNMESFAEAFQCSEGSKMNPAEKCRFY